MAEQDELSQSLESGFSTPWHVFEKYTVKGGFLTGEGKIKSTYFPALQSELPNVISKLNENRDDDVTDFATTYGLFGFFNNSLVTPAEPMRLIRAHIATIRLLMGLAECYQNHDEEWAAAWLNSIRVDHIEGMGGNAKLNVPKITFAARDSIIELHPLFEESAVVTATNTLIRILDENVRGVYRRPARMDDHRIKSHFAFGGMYQMVYWQILNVVESGPLGQGELRRCEACGAPFIATDKRQRFCPKLYKAKQSKCAVAFRVRQLRAKQK